MIFQFSGSQDSPVVLSVLDDVKRIKVNNKKENGAVVQQPTNLYPHLSDIETDNSNTQEEYSDCGGSRCGHYTLECIFFFLCIWTLWSSVWLKIETFDKQLRPYLHSLLWNKKKDNSAAILSKCSKWRTILERIYVINMNLDL